MSLIFLPSYPGGEQAGTSGPGHTQCAGCISNRGQSVRLWSGSTVQGRQELLPFFSKQRCSYLLVSETTTIIAPVVTDSVVSAIRFAPECLQTPQKFTNKSDMWSYGVTLWELFSLGRNPRMYLSPVLATKGPPDFFKTVSGSSNYRRSFNIFLPAAGGPL